MADTDTIMRESLASVEAVFAPGPLRAKCDEMARLCDAGATQFFTGGVHWSVLLADYDKRLQGDAESLDAAFGDMVHCLDLLAEDHGEETQVYCAVAPLAAEKGAD